MNTNRLINMGLRMLMRFGMRAARSKAKDDGRSPNAPKDKRAFRGKQPQGETAKKMRALRRFNRF